MILSPPPSIGHGMAAIGQCVVRLAGRSCNSSGRITLTFMRPGCPATDFSNRGKIERKWTRNHHYRLSIIRKYRQFLENTNSYVRVFIVRSFNFKCTWNNYLSEQVITVSTYRILYYTSFGKERKGGSLKKKKKRKSASEWRNTRED